VRQRGGLKLGVLENVFVSCTRTVLEVARGESGARMKDCCLLYKLSGNAGESKSLQSVVRSMQVATGKARILVTPQQCRPAARRALCPKGLKAYCKVANSDRRLTFQVDRLHLPKTA